MVKFMSNYLYPISKQPLVLPSQRYVIFLQVESDAVGPGGALLRIGFVFIRLNALNLHSSK